MNDHALSCTSVPVCLIKPATFTSINSLGQDAVPPLGLAYVAAALEHRGIPTIGIDAIAEAPEQYTLLSGVDSTLLHGLTNHQIIKRIPANTEIICVSCMFSVDWPFVYPLLDDIRQNFPYALIVAGGEHITAVPEYVLCRVPVHLQKVFLQLLN